MREEELEAAVRSDMRQLVQRQLSPGLLRLADELSMVYAHGYDGGARGGGRGGEDGGASSSSFPEQAGAIRPSSLNALLKSMCDL